MRIRGGEEGGFREMEDLASANIPESEWTLEMPGWPQPTLRTSCHGGRPERPDHRMEDQHTWEPKTKPTCITDSPRLLWRPDQVSNLNLDFYTYQIVLLPMTIFVLRTPNISVPREKMQL